MIHELQHAYFPDIEMSKLNSCIYFMYHHVVRKRLNIKSLFMHKSLFHYSHFHFYYNIYVHQTKNKFTCSLRFTIRILGHVFGLFCHKIIKTKQTLTKQYCDNVTTFLSFIHQNTRTCTKYTNVYIRNSHVKTNLRLVTFTDIILQHVYNTHAHLKRAGTHKKIISNQF